MTHPLPEPEVAARNLRAAQVRLTAMRFAQANGAACASELAMAAQAEVQALAVCRLALAAARREEERMRRRRGHCSIA